MRYAITFVLLFTLVGCVHKTNTNPEPVSITYAKTARDTTAALNGALKAAQEQYAPECQSDASKPACVMINKAIAAHGALITATEAYCGFSDVSQPLDTCKPVATAQAGLMAALDNAQQFLTQLKEVIHP